MPDQRFSEDDTMPRFGWSDEDCARIRAHARRQSDASEEIVARLSDQRLADLKHAPPASAAAAIDDPTLTPADRNALAQHLAGLGHSPTSRRATPGRSSVAQSILRVPIRVARGMTFRMWLVAIGFIAIAVPLGLAWQATPLGQVALVRNSSVRWSYNPDTVENIGYAAGTTLQLIEDDPGSLLAIVRGWTPRQGYWTGEIAKGDLQLIPTR